MKICVGISVDRRTLSDEVEIKRIHSIIESSNAQNAFVPVIHFSFRYSCDILKDISEIKRIWPLITRLQVNDLPVLEIGTLQKACELFSIDIPLSDENFHIVHDEQFRKLVKKNKLFILLDNSKGRGIKESKSSFTKKINTLLDYGLNDIVLCGGFGPDDLDTYFEMRNYYRVNFSIDAETNLKTEGKIDMEKIKLYLLQLIRFDEPKVQGIEQTRKFLMSHRRCDWETIKIHGREFSINPQVFHAGYFPSTAWFAEELCELVKNDSTFCEVGCGSGVISCLVALSNPNLQITATDINPHATENTKLNAQHLGLSTESR